MNIVPPIALSPKPMTADKVKQARAGICPNNCTMLARGNQPFPTLEARYASGEIQFSQCSNCKVVVALERL